jgi:hypothetical protein
MTRKKDQREILGALARCSLMGLAETTLGTAFLSVKKTVAQAQTTTPVSLRSGLAARGLERGG